VVIAVSGWRRAVAVLGRLESHVTESVPNQSLGLIVGIVASAYVVIAVLLWLAF